MEIYDELKELALDEKKVKNIIKKKLIHEDIEKVGCYKTVKENYKSFENDTFYYERKWFYHFASLGVKAAFCREEGEHIYASCNFDERAVFITDFYMIVLQEHNEMIIIPLEKFKKLKIQANGEKNRYAYGGYSKTVKKSPIKGAIVGGLVAGSTGAIVGAIANQGTKTVNVKERGVIYKNEYDLIIETQKGKVLRFYIGDNIDDKKSKVLFKNKGLCEIKSEDEPVYSNDFVDMINKKLNYLIDRANKKLKQEEKQIVVEKTITDGKIWSEETLKKDHNKDMIIGVIIMAIFALLPLFAL